MRILKRYSQKKDIKIRVIILYTADVKRNETQAFFDVGAMQMTIEQALFTMAKEIEDEKTQIFLLTGMMVFSDKVIDADT